MIPAIKTRFLFFFKISIAIFHSLHYISKAEAVNPFFLRRAGMFSQETVRLFAPSLLGWQNGQRSSGF
jgi:hypothetical protein